MTALLVHPASLSLLSGPSSSPLSLPSRFPPSATPRSASAPTGATFIWATTTLWEYDARGRRVGELALPSPPVAVAPFARGLAVALAPTASAAGEVRIFRRGGSGAARWALAHSIPVAGVTAMGAGDGVLVVCGERLEAFATESGVRLDLPSVNVEMPARVLRVLDAPFPSFVVPTPTGLARVALTGSVTPLPLPLPGITDIAVSGDVIAAVGGELLSVGDDIVELGREAAGVAFLTPSTIAVWTTEGDVLQVDAHTLEVSAAEHKRVLAIHPALVPRTARPRAVSERTLSERTNVPKKVGFDKRAVSAPDPSAAGTLRLRPASGGKAGVVVGSEDADQTVSTTSASAARAPRPRGSASSLNSVKEEDAASTADSNTHSRASPTPSAGPGPGWDVVEELRREIANLQMDMLRMGRGLKNEIRSAVAPLADELRSSRETIAAQQAEIERLRRGY